MQRECPIEKCPQCGYLLRGLPAAGRCPECGFAYKPGDAVWAQADPKWRKRVATRVRAAAVPSAKLWNFTWWGLACAAIYGVLARSVGAAVRFGVAWLALVGAVWLAWIIVVGLAALKPGRQLRVVLNAEGLHVFEGNRCRSLPWADLYDVYREGKETILDVRLGRGQALHLPGIADVTTFATFRDEIMRRCAEATEAVDASQTSHPR